MGCVLQEPPQGSPTALHGQQQQLSCSVCWNLSTDIKVAPDGSILDPSGSGFKLRESGFTMVSNCCLGTYHCFCHTNIDVLLWSVPQIRNEENL